MGQRLRITDAAVLLPDGSVREHMDVSAENGIFTEIAPHGAGAEASEGNARGQEPERPEPQGSGTAESVTVLDGRGKLVMPGLADCHMHTGQQLLKGRVLDELPMIWTRIMLPFESTLTPERMRLSASLAALEMIRSGTTSFSDAGSYFMEEAAEVYAQSGLRALLCASTMDEKGLPASIAMDAKQAVGHTDRLYDAYNGAADGRIRVAYSLRSLISTSEELILAVRDRAAERGAIVSAHMNEYPGEVNFFLQRKKLRPFEYLESLGVLGPHFLAAHCIMLSEREKELIAQRDVKVCHCPFSNAGKGVPDTPGLQARGITVGLGTDGAAHGGLSLWNEMKIFRAVMNVTHGVQNADPAVMPASKVIRMSTEDGYRALGIPGGGRIEKGAPADFITVGLRTAGVYPTGNIVNTLLECVTAGDVKDSAVGGQLLMRDREILTLDEERILDEAERYAAAVTE